MIRDITKTSLIRVTKGVHTLYKYHFIIKRLLLGFYLSKNKRMDNYGTFTIIFLTEI